MKTAHLMLTVSVLCLIGCETTAQVPALRTASTQSRQLIEETLAAMLNDSRVIISEDAFTEDAEIIIERRPVTEAGGDRIPGIPPDVQPMHFRLLKRGDNCLLEHVETGEVREVPGLNCSSQ